MVAQVITATVIGLEVYKITVEADTNMSLPSVSIVGLPDIAVSEAKERVIDDTTCLMGRMCTEKRLLSDVTSALHMNNSYSIDKFHGDSNTFVAVDDFKKDVVNSPDFALFLDEGEGCGDLVDQLTLGASLCGV